MQVSYSLPSCYLKADQTTNTGLLQLAVNGPSLVNKVRYVAISLLDALDANNPVSPEGAYLLDFLDILSEIEQVGSAISWHVGRPLPSLALTQE